MSSQDMQFADPEWQPPEERQDNLSSQQHTLPPQPINANRREEPHWQTPLPLEEGYLGPGYVGSQPRTTSAGRSRPAPRRRGSPWLWIVLAIIIIALMSGAFNRGLGNGFGPPNNNTFTTSFKVADNPSIQINSGGGDIHIHTAGSGNVVTIQETSDRGPFGNPPHVNPIVNGNTISLNVDQGGNFGPSSDTSFDVTVPTNAVLQLTTGSGSIEVDGVNGQMTLTSNSGDINVRDSQGPESLQSNSGSISSTNDTLTGSSTLTSDSGSITFNGSISTGDYQFKSNSDSVNVTLPSTSNFQLNASTNSGSIHSNFPSVHINGNGNQANGDIGSNASQTKLTLSSDSGDINLQAST